MLTEILGSIREIGPYRTARRILWKLSVMGLPRGAHITRYSMYRRLEQIDLPMKCGKVLAVSGSANLVPMLGIRPTEIVETSYPECDLLSLPFEDDSFDFVLSDQVLEHVSGLPNVAVEESYRVLSPGGVACHTTCFMNPVHGSPDDYWRFTPNGLRLLHKDWNRVIECDGWGNFGVWTVVKDGIRFEPVPHARWHPLHKIAEKNDPTCPISTWVVAQK